MREPTLVIFQSSKKKEINSLFTVPHSIFSNWSSGWFSFVDRSSFAADEQSTSEYTKCRCGFIASHSPKWLRMHLENRSYHFHHIYLVKIFTTVKLFLNILRLCEIACFCCLIIIFILYG